MKIGRNDPCHWGSGKKYTHCCYGKEQGGPAGIFDELREFTWGREFGSPKEGQAFPDRHTGQRKRTPLDDFQGLTPQQMYGFLHFSFSPPDLVTFSEKTTASLEVPVMRLFGLMATVRATSPSPWSGRRSALLCPRTSRKYSGSQMMTTLLRRYIGGIGDRIS